MFSSHDEITFQKLSFLKHVAMMLDESHITIRKNISSPSSRSRIKPSKKPT
jgi:hypothetical protein